METIIGLFFFLFGLILGSFFNVVGLRLPEGKTFINDRSHCPTCKKKLSWYELIPVFSYLIQGGKCRGCKARISWMYPTVELATGVLFTMSYMKIGMNLELIMALVFISMLMILFVTDVTYMLIPNKILLFFLPLLILMRVIVPLDPWWSSMLGAVVGFGLLFLIILISRGGMGAGDMKLFFLLGIILGTGKVLLTFFLASLLGAVIGGFLLLFKVIKRKQPVPFGPYIVVAAIISYFYGQEIIIWYINLL